MRSVTFLLSKDPYAVDAGDTRVSRLLLDLAAVGYSVRGIALSSERPGRGPVPIRRCPKPPVRLPVLLARAARTNRSLIHTRFNTPELVRAVEDDDGDTVLAEHTYMAEPALDAGRGGTRGDLLINTVVLESMVLASRRGPLPPVLRVEARRTWRDELRCVASAAETVCLGGDELATLREAGMSSLRRLDLVLEPAQSPAALESPRALFLGDRRWAPNRDAYESMLSLWPQIRSRVPAAELVVVGAPHPAENEPADPTVQRLGFVEDLDRTWRSAAVLLAPVRVGGGVRVKILDAARHGVPVVGTPEAVGSIDSYLPIAASDDDTAFVQRAVSLLSDPSRRRREGGRLFEAGHAMWNSDFLQRQMDQWLQAA